MRNTFVIQMLQRMANYLVLVCHHPNRKAIKRSMSDKLEYFLQILYSILIVLIQLLKAELNLPFTQQTNPQHRQ